MERVLIITIRALDSTGKEGSTASKGVEGGVKCTGCGSEDRAGWDGPADDWITLLWVGS